ncbi:MAG TPA: fimbria/pilus periplasmic chaperone [Cellvibrio sp.]|nr:fimbria/pilus periplasmic chaperone [Cellvibrio sp.]
MKGLQFGWLFFFWLLSSSVCAANLAVWPINPRIDAPASATMVWVKNNSATEEIVLQARVLSWRQHENRDQYDSQDDLVVSPPLITVKPGVQQVFRVINRRGIIENVEQELSYRLLIDEIPVANKADGAALNFQMRYSLPLFVGLPVDYQKKNLRERQSGMAATLRYRLIAEPVKTLEIINEGKLNARLSKVRIDQRGIQKEILISEGLLGYVLVVRADNGL